MLRSHGSMTVGYEARARGPSAARLGARRLAGRLTHGMPTPGLMDIRVLFFAFLQSCYVDLTGNGESCTIPSDCTDGLQCVHREPPFAAHEESECAVPCAQDEDCPTGECHFIGTYQWNVCESDGFCTSHNNGCQ